MIIKFGTFGEDRKIEVIIFDDNSCHSLDQQGTAVRIPAVKLY